MALTPRSTETVLDPGLGLVGAVTNIPVVVGACSSGTANSYSRFSDPKALIDAHGQGPAVEYAALLLTLTGGPVGFVRSTADVAASNTAVTASGGGPAITVAGDSNDDYNCRVTIVKGGALGTATFNYTLNATAGLEEAELSFSPTIVVPSGGTYAIPNTGLTLTFAAGTYVADETYSWDSECAGFDATNLGTAVDAVDATSTAWDFIVAVTSLTNGDPTTGAGLATALQSKLAAMSVASKYRAGMISAARNDADPESDFTSVVADRLLVDYGSVRMLSAKPIVGRAFADMAGTIAYAIRASGSLVSTDLKRVPGNGLQDGGALPNVVKIYKDERIVATGLDDIKISTLTTYEGSPGFYITQGRIKSADGSDYVYWPLRRIMDVLCTTVHDIQQTFIGRSVRTNDDGTIDERDALRLEAEVQDAIEAKLISPRNAEGTDGHVSAVRYQIDRTNNINTTSTVISTTGARPLGYIDYINAQLGFTVNVEA